MVPHVDHTKHDINIIITEQGVADFRGYSPRDTPESLIENCAHSYFRDGLREYLDRGVHIPHQLKTAFE